MPAIRKLASDIPFDEAEDEVFFTRAAIKADPDAIDLLPMTDDWLGTIDAARTKDREARIAVADTNAARIVANTRLDDACTHFGDDLFLAVDKDRTTPRWTQFFPSTAGKFIKMAFDKQVGKVKGWLKSNDPALEKHRPELARWANTGADALEQTRAIAIVRGTSQMAREQMADNLTRERDGLFETLSARGRERGLPRDWPKQFFRVESYKTAAKSSDDDTKPNDINSGSNI